MDLTKLEIDSTVSEEDGVVVVVVMVVIKELGSELNSRVLNQADLRVSKSRNIESSPNIDVSVDSLSFRVEVSNVESSYLISLLIFVRVVAELFEVDFSKSRLANIDLYLISDLVNKVVCNILEVGNMNSSLDISFKFIVPMRHVGNIKTSLRLIKSISKRSSENSSVRDKSVFHAEFSLIEPEALIILQKDIAIDFSEGGQRVMGDGSVDLLSNIVSRLLLSSMDDESLEELIKILSCSV